MTPSVLFLGYKRKRKERKQNKHKDGNAYIATRQSLASDTYGIGITTINFTTRLHRHLVIQNEAVLRQIKGGFARHVSSDTHSMRPRGVFWILWRTCILWLKQIDLSGVCGWAVCGSNWLTTDSVIPNLVFCFRLVRTKPEYFGFGFETVEREFALYFLSHAYGRHLVRLGNRKNARYLTCYRRFRSIVVLYVCIYIRIVHRTNYISVNIIISTLDLCIYWNAMDLFGHSRFRVTRQKFVPTKYHPQ